MHSSKASIHEGILFLKRFADLGFTDFQKAIWFEDNDPKRDLVMSLKIKEVIEDDLFMELSKEIEEILEAYKDKYSSFAVDEELNEAVIEYIFDIVEYSIINKE